MSWLTLERQSEILRFAQTDNHSYRFAQRVWSWMRSFARERLVTSAALCYFGLVKKRAAKIDTVGDHMRDIDRTLLRENLKLTPEQRLQKFASFMRFTSELRHAGKTSRLRRKDQKQ